MVTDLEKRLRLLRQQVYGKQEFRVEEKRIEIASAQSDVSYLQHDLFKILTLSSIAIAAQMILFFLTRNHILNLNFF